MDVCWEVMYHIGVPGSCNIQVLESHVTYRCWRVMDHTGVEDYVTYRCWSVMWRQMLEGVEEEEEVGTHSCRFMHK